MHEAHRERFATEHLLGDKPAITLIREFAWQLGWNNMVASSGEVDEFSSLSDMN